MHNGDDIVPFRITRQRAGNLPIQFPIQARHFLSPSLFHLNFCFCDRGPAAMACELALGAELLREQPQRREPRLLDAARLVLRERVGADVAAGLVAAPVVVVAQAADGQGVLGDNLPELALRLVAERDALLCDGLQQLAIHKRLLLGRGEGGEAGGLDACSERVGGVEALLCALGDGGWRLLLLFWETTLEAE